MSPGDARQRTRRLAFRALWQALGWVGVAAVVALSFVAAALFARSHSQHSNAAAFRLAAGPLLPLLQLLARLIIAQAR